MPIRSPRIHCLLAATVGAAALALAAPGLASALPAGVQAKLKAADAPRSELSPSRATQLPGGSTVYRLQQRVGGVPVLNGETVVNDPANARPHLAIDTTSAAVEPQPSASVSRRDAIRIASSFVGSRSRLATPEARQVIDPDGNGGSLAWDVSVPSAQPLGDFEVVVDAQSGAVLSHHNVMRDFSSGKAKLFVPNPVATNDGNQGLKNNHDRDSRLLTSLRIPVVLHRLEGGQRCLVGQYAKVLLGKKKRSVCRRSLNWSRFKRASHTFDALMAYYHVDNEQSYLQSLGFHNIDNRRQLVLADKIKVDNSFYLPSTRTLTLGTGGIPDAQDADVIDHEYGHAIQDNEAPGFLSGNGIEAGSLAEGSADYIAAVMSARDPGTTNVDDVCIFDWDGQAWGTYFPDDHRFCGRRADNPSTLLQEEANQIDCSSGAPAGDLDGHCLGTVWSSALWKLRAELGDLNGQSVMDRDYVAAQFMYTSSETFHAAAQALLAADQDLYGSIHAGTIEAEMIARGFCAPTGC
jgi:Zn-dependent metalloprotease